VSAQLLQALLDLLHCDPPSLVPTDSPSTLPAGELRPRIKCGAWKLSSRDRATQTDRPPMLCWNMEPRLREPLSSASRALWSWGSGFAAQGSGRALAPVHLVAPSLCPERPGPGLRFLPRNSPGWPWNPACLYLRASYQVPTAPSPSPSPSPSPFAVLQAPSSLLPTPSSKKKKSPCMCPSVFQQQQPDADRRPHNTKRKAQTKHSNAVTCAWTMDFVLYLVA
jgi:hypothetical protein